MSDQDSNTLSREELLAESRKPLTVKDRIVGGRHRDGVRLAVPRDVAAS